MNYIKIVLWGIPLAVLAGCTVGRGPGGEIIIGMEVGVLADTLEQGVIGAVGMVPGVGPLLAKILGGATAGGVTIGGTAKLLINRLEKRRREADIAREKAERDRAVLLAQLEAQRVAHATMLPPPPGVS